MGDYPNVIMQFGSLEHILFEKNHFGSVWCKICEEECILEEKHSYPGTFEYHHVYYHLELNKMKAPLNTLFKLTIYTSEFLSNKYTSYDTGEVSKILYLFVEYDPALSCNFIFSNQSSDLMRGDYHCNYYSKKKEKDKLLELIPGINNVITADHDTDKFDIRRQYFAQRDYWCRFCHVEYSCLPTDEIIIAHLIPCLKRVCV